MIAVPPRALSPAEKVWREVKRPLRQFMQRDTHANQPVTAYSAPTAPEPPVSAAASFATFHPADCTVEPEGIALLQQLVRESQRHPGPIIEIGTLVGITSTQMALAKAEHQRIITVDAFCWNPWGLPPDAQEALARQVLHYLTARGEVEVIRADKNEFYRTYRGPAPAMVFLDAMHDYEETRKDIEWAQRAGAKIISGHDYCEKFPGVIQIVDECGGPRRLGGSVWAL